jgi:hypothetical protein
MKTTIVTITLLLLFNFFTFSQQSCANAVEIAFEEYSTCGQIAITNADLDGAIASADLPFPECGDFSETTKDLWYYITVPENVTELAFHVFNAPLSSSPMTIIYKPGLAVYSGTPTDLSLLDCFYNEGGFFANGEIRFETISGLVPGQVLYLRVWDMENNDFSFYIAASVRIEIPEHNCDSPAILPEGGCNILAPKGTIEAPGECGWGVSDNTIYYSFDISADDQQPITITASYVSCFENGLVNNSPDDTELQMAIYNWNGVDCSGVGGFDELTYHGCNNGTGTVSMTEYLEPGLYILALDGYSSISGTSLCTFGLSIEGNPPVFCPQDTIICHTSPPFLLQGAQPIGGQYFSVYPDVISDDIFYPSIYSGPIEVFYSYGPNSCSFFIYDILYPESIPDIEICLVTVDENNHNKIMWKKPITDSLDGFVVYKDNGSSFVSVGLVSYNDESFFIDQNSEPQTQFYRYKIAGMGICGIESQLSEFHQTVMLSMTEVSGSWHLDWTPYVGVEEFTINVLRGTSPDDLEIIASFGSDATEYTDNNPPIGYVYYQIEIVLSITCDPSKSTSVIHSNISTNDPNYYNSLNIEPGRNNLIYNIYPNPASHSFSIQTNCKNADVNVCDLNGRIILLIPNYSGEHIDISKLSKGLYFVKLIAGDKISVGKLVVE